MRSSVVEEVDLRDLVYRVVEANERLAETYQTEIAVHESGEAKAEVDTRRIERILRNLLVNAIEHSEGHPIDILIESDDAAVAIAVRDHGVGFEASQARQVFHRFWRGDAARARTVGGTGLGLAIAMEDANLHGGWLTAWGRPAMGAQFRLTLPKNVGAILETSPLPLVPRDLVGPGGARLDGLEAPTPSAPTFALRHRHARDAPRRAAAAETNSEPIVRWLQGSILRSSSCCWRVVLVTGRLQQCPDIGPHRGG